jgi:hypothetical protein
MISLVVLSVVVDKKYPKSGKIIIIYYKFRNLFLSRQASGANIKIADIDEGSQDRHVTISGTPEQIQLAEFLIHSRYILFYVCFYFLIIFHHRIASEIGGILITH